MKKLLLAAVALGGLTALTTTAATAAPFAADVHAQQPGITQVNYYWNHRHWHHRHYEHRHWRYWN